MGKHIKSFNEAIKYTNKKVIDVHDWDQLVSETYGKPYSFQQQDGCKERGTFTLTIPSKWAEEEDEEMHDKIPFKINGNVMGVKFKKWLSTTSEEINEENPEKYPGQNGLFWERNFYPNVYMVANDLYEKGLIEAGDYVINIDW
jgi:hypothetical protein